MSEPINDADNFSPYKLLRNFSKNRVLPCIFFALVIHVLIIGGTSVNYIYYTWIDPDAKPAESAAGEQGDLTEEPDDEETPGEGKDGEGTPAEKGKDGESPEAGKASGDDDDDPSKAPVVERITDEPEPGETPSEPEGLGISIEDTNR